MSVLGPDIDKAAWARLGSTKEGCKVVGCTRAPAVIITTKAEPVSDDGTRQSTLAKTLDRYCAEHAEQAYVRIVKSL